MPWRCQIFTVSSPAGKLKNWKSEKLIAYPLEPDCQDFRFSGSHPSTCCPKIWPGGGAPSTPDTDPLRYAYINNQLTSGMDPKLAVPHASGEVSNVL